MHAFETTAFTSNVNVTIFILRKTVIFIFRGSNAGKANVVTYRDKQGQTRTHRDRQGETRTVRDGQGDTGSCRIIQA